MSAPCDRCPCPETCLRWEAMCAAAAAEPPDPAALRWIRERSAMGAVPPPVRVDRPPGPAPAVAVDYGAAPGGFRPCCPGG